MRDHMPFGPGQGPLGPRMPGGRDMMPGMPGGRFVGYHHWGVGLFGWLLLLLLATAIVLGIIALVRSAGGRPMMMTATTSAGRPAEDAALAELRLRYARGEISREEYLERHADLGGVPPKDK